MPLPVGGPGPQAGIGETRFSHPLRMREGLGRRSPHVDAGRFATRLSAWYNRVARAGRIVWSSARHWKCRTAATLSRVRIPPCPPVLELSSPGKAPRGCPAPQREARACCLGGRSPPKPSHRVRIWGNLVSPSPARGLRPPKPSCGRGYGGTWFPHVHVRSPRRRADAPVPRATGQQPHQHW